MTVVVFGIYNARDQLYWTFKPKNWAHTFWTNKKITTNSGGHFLDDIVNDTQYSKLRGETINSHNFIWSSKKFKEPFAIKTYLLWKRFPSSSTDKDIVAAMKTIMAQMDSKIACQWYNASFEFGKSPKIAADLHIDNGVFWKLTSALKDQNPVVIQKNLWIAF